MIVTPPDASDRQATVGRQVVLPHRPVGSVVFRASRNLACPERIKPPHSFLSGGSTRKGFPGPHRFSNAEIGRPHVCTPVTHAPLDCSLLLLKTTNKTQLN